MGLMLDEIRRMPPPVPAPRRRRAWRGLLPHLPLLAAPQEERLDYTGATLYRLADGRYRTTAGHITWIIELARFEIRTTGRRLRQQARYLVGYVRGIRTVVFAEPSRGPSHPRIHRAGLQPAPAQSPTVGKEHPMTFQEKARELIDQWIKHTLDHPIGDCSTKLQSLIAAALDQADQKAYDRGMRDALLANECTEQLGDPGDDPFVLSIATGSALAHYARQIGADGIWIIRGATNFDLLFNLDTDILPVMLNIEDAPLYLFARFPAGDDGEPGIETIS